MPIRFRQPPLIELIAELRWGQMASPHQGATPPVQFFFPAQAEEFFMRFGSKVAAAGYGRVERIVPPGFATAPFQTVYRFKKNVLDGGTSLYQLGPGVFSANITPPYHSWESFRPVVEEGVRLMLEARDPSENQPISQATLRYIDKFSGKWTEGRSVAAFMRDVLGFAVTLPEALSREAANVDGVKPLLQLAIPLKTGQQMLLALAQGLVGTEEAIILDTSVISVGPIVAELRPIMNVLDAGHDVHRRIFVEMTKRYHDIMDPVEGSDS